MKKSKFTEAQIIFALRQADTGVLVSEVCRKMGVSEATFYIWNGAARRKKYAGLGVSYANYDSLSRVAGAEENKQLKQLVADLSWDKQMLQDVLKKKF